MLLRISSGMRFSLNIIYKSIDFQYIYELIETMLNMIGK